MLYLLMLLPSWLLIALPIIMVVVAIYYVNKAVDMKQQENKAFEQLISKAFQLEERNRLKALFKQIEKDKY